MIADKVSPLEDLKARFHFIDDETLRENVALSFQYIIFLIAVLDEAGAEGSSIASSTHKDIVAQTACVIEACTHHVLDRYIKASKVEARDIMPKEERFVDSKVLHEFSPGERLLCVRETNRIEKFTQKTQFKSLNKAALTAKIFDETTFKKADELREMRNKVHLAGLSAVDSSYTKADSNKAFELAKGVLERIESQIVSLA